jgi:hypothetical protein
VTHLFDLFLSSRYTAKYSNWAQNVAISLQVFVGALTTALGAALSGKNVRSKDPWVGHVIRLRTMLDVCRNLNPRWCVDAYSVIPGAREGFE